MWDMALASIKLFFAGKLFQHPLAVLRQSLIGMAVTAALLIVLLRFVGMSLPLAAGLAALAGGALQPYLFKDLKYR
jgi:hypothetical protein